MPLGKLDECVQLHTEVFRNIVYTAVSSHGSTCTQHCAAHDLYVEHIQLMQAYRAHARTHNTQTQSN
eukprot:scaffold52986_cov17-Tisochrysis_lutea.AAC.1